MEDNWMLVLLRRSHVAWDLGNDERLVLVIPDDDVLVIPELNRILVLEPELLKGLMQLLLWNMGVKSSDKKVGSKLHLAVATEMATADMKLDTRLPVRIPSRKVNVPNLDMR